MHKDRSAYLGRAMELLRLVGLDDAINKRPNQLSGGMRQRVSLCRALIADPSILLMDEPFSALDAITRDDMNIVLLELWERYRKTVLFVTHSIREAVMLSDRVLVMGRSPSKIIAGIEVPFARPRDFAIGETSEFNELCGMYGIRSPGRVKAKPRPGIDHGRGSRTDRHSGSRVRAPF